MGLSPQAGLPDTRMAMAQTGAKVAVNGCPACKPPASVAVVAGYVSSVATVFHAPPGFPLHLHDGLAPGSVEPAAIVKRPPVRECHAVN